MQAAALDACVLLASKSKPPIVAMQEVKHNLTHRLVSICTASSLLLSFGSFSGKTIIIESRPLLCSRCNSPSETIALFFAVFQVFCSHWFNTNADHQLSNTSSRLVLGPVRIPKRAFSGLQSKLAPPQGLRQTKLADSPDVLPTFCEHPDLRSNVPRPLWVELVRTAGTQGVKYVWTC